jgi:hypothetical protein
MRLLKTPISLFWLYLVLSFFAIWFLPWFPGKTGELLPVNAAYGTPFENWKQILAVHFFASVISAFLVAFVIKIAHYFLPRNPADPLPGDKRSG